MQHPVPTRAALLLTVMAATAAPVTAAPLTNANIFLRTTTNAISFSDLSFAGASAARSDRMEVAANVGDSGVFSVVGFRPDFEISVISGAGVDISNLLPADTAGVVRYTTTIVGALDQNFTQSWAIPASTTGTGTLTVGVSTGGLQFLEFFGRNQGFLSQGGTFDYNVSMPGDWSQPGTASGQVQFLGVNPGFAITQNFEYDALNDLTVVRIVNGSYDYALPTTDLHFILWGQPVPEAPTLALLSAGLAVLTWRLKQARVLS